MGARDNNVTNDTTRESACESMAECVRAKGLGHLEKETIEYQKCSHDTFSRERPMNTLEKPRMHHYHLAKQQLHTLTSLACANLLIRSKQP